MPHDHERAAGVRFEGDAPGHQRAAQANMNPTETTMIHGLKLLACATSLASLSLFSPMASAADPIKIGVSGPFTGGSSSMGVSMRDGVRLAADEINKIGGVLGRKLELVERDDEAKNERGVQIAEELINKEKVVATVGYINTGVALASQRFYQDAKIPVHRTTSRPAPRSRSSSPTSPTTTSSATRPTTRSRRR